MFTVDASVWVNASGKNELGYAQSRRMLAEIVQQKISIYVPTLILAEVGGALSRRRTKLQRINRIITQIATLQYLHLIPIDLSIAQHAQDLAIQHRLKGADAIYVAIASLHRCKLVSLDQEHLGLSNDIVVVQTPTQALTDLIAGSGQL